MFRQKKIWYEEASIFIPIAKANFFHTDQTLYDSRTPPEIKNLEINKYPNLLDLKT